MNIKTLKIYTEGDNLSNDQCPNTRTHIQAHNFLNCAAPKSKIAQNCYLIRQIQEDYPPYPSDLGYYGEISANNTNVPQSRPTHLSVQVDVPAVVPPDKLKKHPGILKNYKSCPVSPVHEELEWAVVQDRSQKITFNESCKRHTLYSDDAKTILDMIHSDTEKMIEEITKKYGDLNEFEPKSLKVSRVPEKASTSSHHHHYHKKIDESKFTAKKEKHEHDFLSEEDANFSSDSLEDCSLDLECDKPQVQKKKGKGSCKKHHKKGETIPPKRSVSEYFIYEESFTYANPYRKVSLSDILNEDEFKEQQRFLETQRHSSASFFLGQQYPGKSQESILSDDYSAGGGAALSFCNSMESILSDESECKSAPLEVLFEKCKLSQKNIGMFDPRFETNSKSYGSSPNSTMFDYYMQNEFQDDDKCDISNYGLDSLDMGKSFKVVQACRSPIHRAVTTSLSVPQFSTISFSDDIMNQNIDDEIPSLTSKVAQYNTQLNKSLSKDFANQRKQASTNPFNTCDSDLFVRKTVTSFMTPSSSDSVPPPIPPPPFSRGDIFADAASSSAVYVMKKSCSFEIEMGSGRRIVRNSKKFEQNLKRFEKDRKEQLEEHLQLQKSDYNLEMGYVPHKPPVAHRRSSSMKGRGKSKIKDRFNTVGQVSCSKTSFSLATHTNEMRDFVNKDFFKKMKPRKTNDEQSFEIYIAEKGVSEDDNMDSLEIREKERKSCKEILLDSLDSLAPSTSKSPMKSVPSQIENLMDSKYITQAEYNKFRDIEKKIDIINKLVELEEKKLEQERIAKENRMKPLFDGNTTQRGFVKNLTKNFDELAKNARDELKNVKNWCMTSSTPIEITSGKMRRNFSLPDVLEGAKLQAFEFNDDDLISEPKEQNQYDFSNAEETQFNFDPEEDTAGPDEGVTNKILNRKMLCLLMLHVHADLEVFF